VLEPRSCGVLDAPPSRGMTATFIFQSWMTPSRDHRSVCHELRGCSALHDRKDERKALAKVVAWFDREGGRTAGTVGRIARAGAATESGPKQMDCIDLTANVTEL
jgi:hypothetical protein